MLYIISAQNLLDNLNDNLYETNSSLLREISIKDLSFSQFEEIINLLVEKKVANVISKLYVIGPVTQWGNPMGLKALPTNIGKLTGLIHFACCYQNLRAVPKELGYCSLLESLNFHYNDIHGVPLTLGNCSNLKQIGLSMNPYTINSPTDSAYMPSIKTEWHAYIAPYKGAYMALATRLPSDLAHRIMLYTEHELFPGPEIDLVTASIKKSLTWLATKKPKEKLKTHTVKELENTMNLPSQGEIKAYAQEHGIPCKIKKP